MKWLLIGMALAMAQMAPAEEMRSVAVTGNASIDVAPDRARISVGVHVNHIDPQIAMNDLARQAQGVVAAVKAAGIEEKNIQTSNLSLQPYWDGEKNNGFLAANTLTIEVSSIEKMPALLSALSKAGMNELGGLQFFSSLQSSKENEAMLLAVSDARTRAEALATAAGMKLGDPITIDYSSGGVMPMPMMMAKTMSADAAQMPVEAGSVGISAQVNIRYEMVK